MPLSKTNRTTHLLSVQSNSWMYCMCVTGSFAKNQIRQARVCVCCRWWQKDGDWVSTCVKWREEVCERLWAEETRSSKCQRTALKELWVIAKWRPRCQWWGIVGWIVWSQDDRETALMKVFSHANGVAVSVCQLVGWSVYHCGPHWNISATIWWIVTTFYTHINILQRMNPTCFSCSTSIRSN